MQNQHLDIPFNLSETPEQILDSSQPAYVVNQDSEEAAHQLLLFIEQKIKASPNELFNMYETALPAFLKTHYQQKGEWVQTYTLEQKYNTEYKSVARDIYNEYWIRNYSNKLKNRNEKQLEDRMDLAWETYTSIFEREVYRVNFHPIMIWDMMEGFLTYYFYYRTKKNVATQNEFFNTEKTKKILNKLLSEIPDTFTSNLSTKQVAGYYSLVALIILSIHEKNYEEGIKLISRISLKQISVYSKAFASLLSLFLAVSFCYFMLEDYSKASKLCETIAFFYQKNRKYFNKASCRESISHLNEKCVSLLCLTYIFLEEKPKTALMEIFKNSSFKAKQREGRQKISDCFFKMKQNDVATFTRVFTLYSYEYHIWDLVQVGVDRFKDLKQITLNTIIQNYQRISLNKMSSMLRISQEQILKKLNSFSVPEEGDCAWINTVMNPIMKQTKKVKVQIHDGIAIFDSQIMDDDSSREWLRYREELAYLKEKVKNI